MRVLAVTLGKNPLGAAPALAALLVTMLACAAPAPAAAAGDPVSEGRVEIRLAKSFLEQIRRHKIGLLPRGSAVRPAPDLLALSVAGGVIDPTSAAGELNLSGGFALERGKHAVSVRALTVNTSNGTIRGLIAGRTMNLGSFTSLTSSREGFGVGVAVSRMELTPAAIRSFRRGLDVDAWRNQRKRHALGSLNASTQPRTVEVLPGALVRLFSETKGSPAVSKLFARSAFFQPISPAMLHYSVCSGPGQFPTFVSIWLQLSGGWIAPDGSSGILQTVGGARIEAPALSPNPILRAERIAFDLGVRAASATLARAPKPLDGVGASTPILQLDPAGEIVKVDPDTRTIDLEIPVVAITAGFAGLLNQTFAQPQPPAASSPDLEAGDRFGTLSVSVATR